MSQSTKSRGTRSERSGVGNELERRKVVVKLVEDLILEVVGGAFLPSGLLALELPIPRVDLHARKHWIERENRSDRSDRCLLFVVCCLLFCFCSADLDIVEAEEGLGRVERGRGGAERDHPVMQRGLVGARPDAKDES